MLAALIRQSSEIQKILAFDGIFEELFLVVTREGGLESQSVVTNALRCVDTLLLFDIASSSAPEVTSSYVTTWVRVGVNRARACTIQVASSIFCSVPPASIKFWTMYSTVFS